jgi:hypothetical protein
MSGVYVDIYIIYLTDTSHTSLIRLQQEEGGRSIGDWMQPVQKGFPEAKGRGQVEVERGAKGIPSASRLVNREVEPGVYSRHTLSCPLVVSMHGPSMYYECAVPKWERGSLRAMMSRMENWGNSILHPEESHDCRRSHSDFPLPFPLFQRRSYGPEQALCEINPSPPRIRLRYEICRLVAVRCWN